MSEGLPHIVHITLLNPALHSRIFYKMAVTQAEAGYQVTVIGRDPATEAYMHQGIRIIPIPSVPRLSRARIALRRQVGALADEAAPDILQVHSPELIREALRLKAKRPGMKLIYDVHEDYAQNIRHGGYYPPVLRDLLAARVRKQEKRFVRECAAVFYAEACFDNILGAPEGRHIVVGNKYRCPAQVNPVNLPEDLPILLHTGTLALNWGVKRAIELWQGVHRHRPCRLVMAGHGHDEKLIAEIREMAASSGHAEHFHLLGGDEYLPYETMAGLFEKAAFGLALYEPRLNIRERIPTKFYEFMAVRRPVLFTRNLAWDAMNAKLDFGKSLTFPLSDDILKDIASELEAPASHYFSKGLKPEDYAWEPEGRSMTGMLSKL